MQDNALLAIFGLPGGAEWIVIGVIALVIFGKRLPDVARSMGKSIVEFKRGLKGVKDDIDNTPDEYQPPQSLPPGDDRRRNIDNIPQKEEKEHIGD